ncbi:DUF7344 domain-containing protein [Halomarina ordinaria]|uniref:DUF7344 domain-containing protein n=1 Tax=Halomarina ordinaria TaxID=3033939 RepID=A0ABD5UDY4_9EURY|nr:hypothetical protein [Halomarina sp. PSRA2]
MERDGHVSVDDIFQLLSHNRRRLALQYFKQYHNPIALDDLAFRIARWEQPPAATPARVEVDQTRTALQKTHLPMFSEMGFIEYQTVNQTIRCNDATISAAMESAINVIGFLFDERNAAGDE